MEKAATTPAMQTKSIRGIDSAVLVTFTAHLPAGQGQFARKFLAVISRFSGKHTARNTIVDNAHISGAL
jgi:hypothetical protein